MERKINSYLKRWKKDLTRKPLLIYGNKQVGKTYTAIKFGEEEYKNVVYFNCDNNLELLNILKREKTIDRIIEKLSLLSNEMIMLNDTLIIFDNVNDVDIVNGLRVFGKFDNGYHIIMITSLKENLNKFKGEEFHYKAMYPLDFEEYLIASGNNQLVEFIKTSFKNNTAMPFHSVALEYFDDFVMTGGMPEAVAIKLQDKNTLLSMPVYDKVLDSYRKEIGMLDNLIDITRCNEVLDSIPFQLQKQNRKFQYGLIKLGSRSKDYDKSISFLHNNGLAYKCYKISNVKSPLSSCKDVESFKLYMSDTGLLFYQMHLNKNKFLNDYKMKNIIYENCVAINLLNSGYGLYYYQSEGKAEVSFVIQTRAGRIIPIELVDKNVSKSKALTLFMNKFGIKDAIRITEDNFSVKKGVRYIPIYALFCLADAI